VSAGGVEESNDPLVMFGRGVAHAVAAMIFRQSMQCVMLMNLLLD